MTPRLKAFLDELANLAPYEKTKQDLDPYKEILKNVSYIYPVDLEDIVKYFNRKIK